MPPRRTTALRIGTATAITTIAAAYALVSACSSSSAVSSTNGGDASTSDDASASANADGAVNGGEGSAGFDAAAGADDDGAIEAPACDAAVGPGDRVITITNACPGQTLVVGVNGGYVEDCDAGACPAGTTCLTSRSPPGCFWDFPHPACGSAVLGSGASATYVLDAPPIATGTNAPIKWSGNLYASTQCASDGGACETAQCATSVQGTTEVGACPDGIGPSGPATLAEFTLLAGSADYYDISAINGVNVPVAMAPIGGVSDPGNPYTCASAGAVSPSTGLAACTWTFDTSITLGGTPTDESPLLRAVTPGGTTCSSDAQCSGGDKCGVALAFGGSAATQSCGKQVGWWTADELCAYTGNALSAPIDCSGAVASQGTNADLFGCSGANASSCYSANADATCCGCPAWNIGGQTLAVPSGFTCHANNTSWQSAAEPWAAFSKNACPTAYSFPFDDATSTFTCATANPSAANPNVAGYAITFCPGGRDGL